MRKFLKTILASVVFACGAVASLVAVPSVAQAQSGASLTMNTNPATTVHRGQQIIVQGKLRVNGHPVAHKPVTLFLRAVNGPDVFVASAFTNQNGDYTLIGTAPNRPGSTLQVSVVSGGGAQFTARVAKILQLR